MPYLDFPTTWPIFPDKNQVADWLEFYAKTLDIPVWTRTTFEKGDYSDATGSWTVETVKRDATGHVVKRMTLHPSHVVYSGNGHIFGQPNIPEWAQDSSVFKGVLYHAGEHTDTTRIRDVQNKRIVVVGSNTGSHDICMDYVRAGAKSVTMIQRGTSIVASKETVMTAFPPPRAGMSSEDAIFERAAVPTKVQLTLIAGVQKMSELRDKELLDGLRKTEYALSTGECGDSILARALGRRGGFYLNQGGSEAVIDGRIKVMRSPKGIERLTPTGMVLLDGREVEADVIVLATSWKLFENAIEDVMGEDTASRTKGIWGIDAEGELGGVSWSLVIT
jgi:cation diffusion facilitator CzcD-associated flavoprotein CzcO